MTPYYAISAATPAPSVDIVTIGNHPNATGQWIWLMNGYPAEADIANPVLPLAMARDKAIFRPQWNLFDEGERVVVRVLLNNPIDFPHPMHLHGHNCASNPFLLLHSPPDYAERLTRVCCPLSQSRFLPKASASGMAPSPTP